MVHPKLYILFLQICLPFVHVNEDCPCFAVLYLDFHLKIPWYPFELSIEPFIYQNFIVSTITKLLHVFPNHIHFKKIK